MFVGLVVLCLVPSNIVRISYVPPNEIVVQGILYLGGHHEKVLYVGNFTPTTTTVPASIALDSSSLIRNAPNIVSDYVYTYYQTVYKKVTGVLVFSTGVSPRSKENANMVLSLSSLSPDITIVYNFYGRHMLYIGDVPESYRSHMVSVGTVTYTGPTTDLSHLFVAMTSTTTKTFVLNMGAWDHVFSASDCGIEWSFGDTSVFVPCSEATVVGTSIVSLRALSLGLHVKSGTLYRPNTSEFDHFTSGVLLFVILVLYGTIVFWTRFLSSCVVEDAKRIRLWIRLSSQNVVMSSVLLLLLLSRNMWAAMQHNHGMYNIETIDTIGMDALNVYIVIHSYCFVPCVVGTCLLIIAYGNSVHGSQIDTHGGWFTWNIGFMQSVNIVVRIYLYVGVVIIALLTLVLYWTYMKQIPYAIVSSVYTLCTITYWSSSGKFHALMKPVYIRLQRHDKAFLIYLTWSYEILVLMTIPSNTPYDIGGAFALQFHTFIALGTGVLILISTGKTVGILRCIGTVEEIIVVGITAAFAFSYATLFGIGSMYGTTGGIRGLSSIILVCSVSLASGFFAIGHHVVRFE